MQRALELAELGKRYAPPNPLVGCVIAYNETIIGEGWHKRYGEAHAEVNAVESVADKSLLSEATAYVTLEPCSHFGKTPPCADLLIRYGLKRVVICNEDPFPLVNGGGIKKLRDAGIEVEVGVLAEKGRELNKRFFTSIEKKRPYVILKWAETADSYIAAEGGKQLQISGKLAQVVVHKWRSEEEAIMVGTNTVLNDNPRLNVRSWTGRNPLRVVIDKKLKISANSFVFDQTQKTLIFNDLIDKNDKSNTYICVPGKEAYLPFILSYLHAQNIQSLFVEGGANLQQYFLDAGLFDELRVFKSTSSIGSGVCAPTMPKNSRLHRQETIGNDTLSVYLPTVS